jgi:hypothetical protein
VKTRGRLARWLVAHVAEVDRHDAIEAAIAVIVEDLPPEARAELREHVLGVREAAAARVRTAVKQLRDPEPRLR